MTLELIACTGFALFFVGVGILLGVLMNVTMEPSK
jgi:hypothetical protein